MERRLELHQILCDILGNNQVYFQPPSTIRMLFPCIVYNLTNIESIYADNFGYEKYKGYTVTYIDTNPDSDIPSKIADLELSSFDRQYVTDNLYHTVFMVFY